MVIMANIVNFDEVKESRYISEAGTYTVKVVKHERKVSLKGNDMDVYDLETKDGESIKLFLSLNANALFKYKIFIRAIKGLDAKASIGSVDLDAIPREAVGKKMKINVVHAKDVLDVETGTMKPSKFMEIKDMLAIDF